MRLGKARSAFTFVEILVVIAILAIILGLSFAAIQRVRVSMLRITCQHNLHQMVLGLQNYADNNGHIPSAYKSQGTNPG